MDKIQQFYQYALFSDSWSEAFDYITANLAKNEQDAIKALLEIFVVSKLFWHQRCNE